MTKAYQIRLEKVIKEEVQHYINKGILKNDAIKRAIKSYTASAKTKGKETQDYKDFQYAIEYLKKLTIKSKIMATKKKTVKGKKSTSTKKKAPTAAQKKARAAFSANAKKAAALVKSGKARTLKSAWNQIKK